MELEKIRKQSNIVGDLIKQLQNKLIDHDKSSVKGDLKRLTKSYKHLIKDLNNIDATLDGEELRKVRHNLRNLFGAINGYSEMMEEEAPIGSVERHILVSIINTVQQCIELLGTTRQVQPQESWEVDLSDPLVPSEQTLGHILVVDDNKSNRKLLERYLSKLGHTVSTSRSAKKALKVIKEKKIELILLDVLMPEVNGFEMLKLLKENRQTSQIPVIMVSGVDDYGGIVKSIHFGADDYLTKPYNPTILQARIGSSLARKRGVDREREMVSQLEKRNTFIRQIFGRYLTNDIVDTLLENPTGLHFGGATKTVTIVMTDIRSFTNICENLSAQDVVSLLNNYLEVMNEIIIKYQGTLDEIIGDALLILFGAPIEREKDADRAIACAIEMQQAMSVVNAKNRSDGLPEISMGIGINTGEVVAGNIGSHQRSKYAVVGHSVNVTARIESFTKGGQILASQMAIDATSAELVYNNPRSEKMKGVSKPVVIHDIKAIRGDFNLELG